MRITLIIASIFFSGCTHYAVSPYTRPVMIKTNKPDKKSITSLQCDKNNICYMHYSNGTRSYEEHY